MKFMIVFLLKYSNVVPNNCAPCCYNQFFFFCLGQPIIDGDGLQFFTENSTFELFCSYSTRNIIPDSLQFFDKNNNKLTVDRGFNRTIVSSSQDLVNVSLSKSRIQAEDNGRYTCRYKSGPDFYVTVAIVRGILKHIIHVYFNQFHQFQIYPLLTVEKDKREDSNKF